MSERSVSLKQIAIVLDCPVERIRNIAKKPIVGQPYDPKAINWDAVDNFIKARLEKSGYESVDEVYDAAAEVEIATKSAGGHTVEMLAVDGSETTPKRKVDLVAGDFIAKKGTGERYVVDFVNDTIIVYSSVECSEGKITLSHAIGNRIFNNKFNKVQ